jgi:hypothetical protein
MNGRIKSGHDKGATRRAINSDSIFKQRKHSLAISPRVFARVLLWLLAVPFKRGRREYRRSLRPQPRVRKVKKHTSMVTTVTPESPGIPRAMVYGLFRVLPGDRAFLPLPQTRQLAGPHDFAVRRLCALVFVRLPASIASRPAS